MRSYFILVLAVFSASCGYAQVYDCFLFFNELEILDIRLHELYDHVDKFVLVESVETFRGNPKPLYYEQNCERYKKFSDKIIHIVLEEGIDTTNPWDREAFQRNQIMRGLKECSSDDIIMVSDVDEIIRGSSVQDIVRALHQERKTAIVCGQTMYQFYLNTEDVSVFWARACATTFNYLKQVLPERFRKEGEREGSYFLLLHAGWHFTWMGGLEFVIKKLESYSHQEGDFPENKTEKAVMRYMSRCCKLVPLDDTFPAYVLDNQEYFQEKGYLYEDVLRKPQRRNIFRSQRPAN